MKKELTMIMRRVKDPRVSEAFISITAADCTPDLKFAKIYYSVMGGDKKEVAAAFGRHQQPGEQAPDLSVHQSCHIQDQKREDVRLYIIQDIPDHIEYYKLQRQIADSVFSEFLFKIAHQIPPGS
jgi:hypothetical protein